MKKVLCDIELIDTSEPSVLVTENLHKKKLRYDPSMWLSKQIREMKVTKHHIYAISDEPIEIDDYIFNIETKTTAIYAGLGSLEKWRKIEFTNDTNLTKAVRPHPDFLQDFVAYDGMIRRCSLIVHSPNCITIERLIENRVYETKEVQSVVSRTIEMVELIGKIGESDRHDGKSTYTDKEFLLANPFMDEDGHLDQSKWVEHILKYYSNEQIKA